MAGHERDVVTSGSPPAGLLVSRFTVSGPCAALKIFYSLGV